MLFYIAVFLCHMPWILLLLAAADRVRTGHTGRVYRLQLEGVALALLGTLTKWLIHDPHFGLGREGLARWGEWFDRGERGIFWIGVLLFVLGYVRERRPRPGLAHWPAGTPAFAWAACMAGALFGAYLYFCGHDGLLTLPWGAGRAVFVLGLIPFALGYMAFDRKIQHRTEPE
jgi:hypothetical protein